MKSFSMRNLRKSHDKSNKSKRGCFRLNLDAEFILARERENDYTRHPIY